MYMLYACYTCALVDFGMLYIIGIDLYNYNM